MMQDNRKTITVNGRRYDAPTRPTVVICLDGSEPGYVEQAIEASVAPTFARFMKDGAHVHAASVIPSFTNPNNLSIITGRPPAVHGIAGNYFYDTANDAEVMMNDPKFLRAPTILAGGHDAGYKVAAVTAKDKLRTLLAYGLDYASGRAIAFSSEKADQATKAANGIDNVLDFVGLPLPEVYSADLSRFVFAAGVKLVERHRPDLMYLSTTDYIQHKVGPGTKIANDFYAMIDGYLARLDALGCNIVATADHGMNDKFLPDGKPDVIYLQDVMDDWTGKGAARVILPITDPYVAHHGSLGSFATIYTPDGADADTLLMRLRDIKGIEVALSRKDACARFELPPDRIGDIVVISTRHKVLGTSASRHDLSGLTEPLRSHGGLTEQRVPLIANRKIVLPAGHALRNFDAFDVALNRIQ
ncbi:phosphonoacetate hydrolase [Bradyrhizobium sp. USDA 3240]